MPTGTVKWFNNAKGFGFILPEDSGDDLFAHYSSIEMEGYKTLKAGQKVTFEVSTTDKGGHAKNIRVLNSEKDSNEKDADADPEPESAPEAPPLIANHG